MSEPTYIPLYVQIKQLIMGGLEAGEWKPGDAIPSEIDLAARFKVSQGTVRKAVDELAAEHHLVRRQGKGTFVATHHEPRTQFRFLRLVPNEGEPAQPESRVLDCRRARASADVARLLDLKAGDAVVVIRRVLSFAGAPAVLEEVSLPAVMFRGLDAAKLELHRGSLYGLFETEYATRMIRAEEKLRAVAADRATATLLDVAPGTPLLAIDRVAFTYGDKPVEMRRGLYRTDHHHYRNDLA